MASNPPILAVPASVPEPFERIQNYRFNQLKYAAQYAVQGKEEIETEVGLKSFRNHLPPTPNRSMVLSGGSSVGSNGSRSRGMVARMKPRNPGIQATASAAFSCAPTEIDTTPLHESRQKTLSIKKPIVQTVTPIPLQASDHPVPVQRPAVKCAEGAEQKKRQRDEDKVSPGRNARELLAADETDSTQRDRLVQSSANESSVVEPKPRSSSQSTRSLRPRRKPVAAFEEPSKRKRLQADSGRSPPRVLQSSSDVKPLQGSRIVGTTVVRPRPRGVEPVSQFRPGNVAGRDGRITVKPRGVFNKGTTSGLYKVVQPEITPANRAFSESRFFRQPPQLVKRSGASPSPSTSSDLGLPSQPTAPHVGIPKAEPIKTAEVVITSASANVQSGSGIRSMAVSRRGPSPAEPVPKSTALSNPPPRRSASNKGLHAPDANDWLRGSSASRSVRNLPTYGAITLAPDSMGVTVQVDRRRDQQIQPAVISPVKTRIARTSKSPSRPLPNSVSHRRPRRRPAPQLPPRKDDSAPQFGSAHEGDVLVFLNAPATPPFDDVDARLVAKEQEYLDELSLESFEDKLFKDVEVEGIPVEKAPYHPALDVAEYDARSIWRPRRI